MENASKALIMAASILLGVMIISIGVALFTTFSNFSKSTLEKVEETKIADLNNNYLKYENGNATAHDIVSVANLARENNIKYEIQNQTRYDENTYYVQVKVDKIYNFEKLEEEEKNNFLKENSLNGEETKYYKCKEVKISNVTKRVMYIEFAEIK